MTENGNVTSKSGNPRKSQDFPEIPGNPRISRIFPDFPGNPGFPRISRFQARFGPVLGPKNGRKVPEK